MITEMRRVQDQGHASFLQRTVCGVYCIPVPSNVGIISVVAEEASCQ